MTTMKWREVHPEQSDWKRQINIIALYSGRKIGSIILYDDERSWNYVIDGYIDFLDAETVEEAKKNMEFGQSGRWLLRPWSGLREG